MNHNYDSFFLLQLSLYSSIINIINVDIKNNINISIIGTLEVCKNLLNISTSDTIIWSIIANNIVIITSGLALNDNLNIDSFSLLQFKTCIFCINMADVPRFS